MSIRSRLSNRFSWEGLAAAAVALSRAWSRRRMVGRLGALDDHMLADIGITRQDVLSVLAEPLFVDVSEKLAQRADETRHARHAALRDVVPDERLRLRARPAQRAA